MYEDYMVVNKDGEEVKPGTYIEDFRGDTAILEGIDGLPTEGKSGYVYVACDLSSKTHLPKRHQRFYPQVFDLEIIPREKK